MTSHDPGFEFGALSPQQLAAVFEAVPADVTFADADGVIRYYSRYRVFSRSAEVLGTALVDCHGSSKTLLIRLLAEFASGARDEYVYSADKDGREVIVRDVAVRDPEGTYLGCIEVATWADTGLSHGDH